MSEFYGWPWPARLAVTLLLALCVLAQTLAAVLCWYNRKRLRGLPELGLLALILYGSALYGQVLNSFDLGLIAPMPYRGSAWVFLAALLLLLLARGIAVSLRRSREIRTGISALSIKNAIDSLHTGVLFGEPDGYILLCNARMQRLMTAVAGKVYRNGGAFWALVEEQPLRRLPDGSVWMFTRTELRIERKRYIQLTAADITRRWELTAQLQRQNEELQQRSEELKRTIADLHALSQEREAQKAKMRAHDVLGQRLTLLLRTVRNEQALDYGLLRALSRSLLEELKAGQSEPAPEDFLESLRQKFASIGVELKTEGALPEDPQRARLFVDLIREGATNAVRHGFATCILAQMRPARLRVTNNGPPPPEDFTEGGGLGGMRRKLEPFGGALRITSSPQFVLEIDIPGGDDHA